MAAFRRMLSEFRTSYDLHFVPRGVAPSGFHTIDVHVTRPGAEVRGPALIEEPFTVAVIDNANDYATGWARSSRSAPPPDVSFDTEVVVYLGMAGSSSCPETFQHLVVDEEAAHVFGEWDGGQFVGKDCTADLHGQGIVLAVSRDALPAGQFTLTLREALTCADCPDHPDQVIVNLR